MHVVLFGCAFPERPEAGVDRVHVRRACALAERAAVTAVVPTPWAPPGIGGPGDRWARHRATPHHAEIDGIRLLFPRYLQVPRMGAWAGVTMALGAARTVRRLQREGCCDVLFAQTLLPEGLAAVLLGRWLGLPVACLGRGTDVHGLARSATTRRLARWTVRRATAIGVVANALAEALGAVASAAPCTVLANGVDLERFTPGSAVDARRALGLNLQAPLALYVGRLAEGKGLDTLLDAFAALRALVPAARLVLVGTGRLRAHLERRVLAAGLALAVRFAGEVPHHAVARWIRAADVLVLPSEAEGFPNVVREALACGRPVVATTVGDLPRVVTPAAGRLVAPADPAALAWAIAHVLSERWDPAAIRAQAIDMTWERNAEATVRFLATTIRGTA